MTSEKRNTVHMTSARMLPKEMEEIMTAVGILGRKAGPYGKFTLSRFLVVAAMAEARRVIEETPAEEVAHARAAVPAALADRKRFPAEVSGG